MEVMRAYRHGGRFSTLMGRLAPAYSEADLAAFADYFSGQAFILHKQRVDWDLAQRGRQLHRRYCRECHGDLEKPADEDVPSLNGRWMDYLHWTLQDYLLGISQADEQMSEQLIRLIRRHGDTGIQALIHYYGSAHPPVQPQE
jgi:cytochrome subunit of sulfide dehydrogenase